LSCCNPKAGEPTSNPSSKHDISISINEMR
jgi:hypothetical protein